MGQLKNSRKAVLKEIDREWEGEECKPGCCEWKINVASVNQDVSTNVKQAAGIHSQQLLCSWDFPSMRQVPDLNIASTIQYDGGSTWALFHFIQFSSIVIFIYYMFSLSLFLYCMSLSSPYELLPHQLAAILPAPTMAPFYLLFGFGFAL